MGNEVVKERLREALVRKNMRQADLVAQTGIDKSQISSYLAGKYRPKQENLSLLAEALEVNEYWLLGLDEAIETTDIEKTARSRLQTYAKHIYGEREFEKIAIVGGIEGTGADELCAPCGVCRQVMMEFCDPESFQIILANGKDKHVQVSLKEMVPYGSSPKDAILKNQEK